jgi:hypothetical protein
MNNARQQHEHDTTRRRQEQGVRASQPVHYKFMKFTMRPNNHYAEEKARMGHKATTLAGHHYKSRHQNWENWKI